MKTVRPAASNVPSLVRKLAFLPLLQLLLAGACILGRVAFDPYPESVTLWLVVGQAAIAAVGGGLAIRWLGRLCRVHARSSASIRLGIAAELLLVAVLVALVRLGICASAMRTPDATYELVRGPALWLVAAIELALRGAAFVLATLGLVRLLEVKMRRDVAGVALRVLAWSALTAALTAFVVLLQVLGARDVGKDPSALAVGLVALACGLIGAGAMAGLGRQVARRS